MIFDVKKKNVVGERVRQARRNAKPPITQNDLVARLQVLGMKIDQSGISKIEGGRRPVFDFEVIALSKALNVMGNWLLEEGSEKNDSAK